VTAPVLPQFLPVSWRRISPCFSASRTMKASSVLARSTMRAVGGPQARPFSSRMSTAAAAYGEAQLCSSTQSPQAERLTAANLNPWVTSAEFAVRGRVLDRALQLEAQLQSDPASLPFDELVECNVGNPQSLGQMPLTFPREVMSLAMNPRLLDDENLEITKKLFNSDSIARAKKYLSIVPSMGSYTHSQGLPQVRQEIANFIEERDKTGFPVNPDNIFITNGASEGVKTTLQTIMRGAPGFHDGMLVPIPQYPLYSATITTLNGSLVPYGLDEATDWGLNLKELQSQLAGARESGVAVRGVVVINPGNPTGKSLTVQNMKDIVKICVQEGLVLMADEVYQENIWAAEKPFVSFRKVAMDLGYRDTADSPLQMISYHSISKGFLGECGIRGGYFELFGIDEKVRTEIYKLSSISLCPNTPGQIATGLMVQPPKKGDESHPLYAKERQSVLDSLLRRATRVAEALDALPGVNCPHSDGALYAFPRIDLPDKLIAEAKDKGIPADELYCLRLLETTGLIVVPGSGFGQPENTWHFRTTFLPPETKISSVLERVSDFHNKLMARYA